MTFDYELAWQELALPAYKSLPEAVTKLLILTAEKAEGLSQVGDCTMPWPEDGSLKAAFEAMDSETLANASHVVYYYSHWFPGAIAGDAPRVPGTGWKFSHYADQILRERLGTRRASDDGVNAQIHEGTIRICYGSRDLWTWNECFPATPAGINLANARMDGIKRKLAVISDRCKRDEAASAEIEKLKVVEAWPGWNTAKYMAEECEIENRRLARMPKPDKAKLRQKIIDDCAKDLATKTQIATTERDAHLWLLDRDISADNCIFYSHRGQFCFGWKQPYTGEARLKLLEALKEFPFSYDVK